MAITLGGDKVPTERTKFRSAETSISILKGAPVFYAMNGTRDGIDGISAEGLANAKQSFFAGISMQDVLPGKYREALAYGVYDSVRIVTGTRAATTDVWGSYAAIATGDVLSLLTATGSVQAFTRAGAAAAGSLYWIQAIGTLASATTQASSVGSATFSASLYSTNYLRCFVRSL